MTEYLRITPSGEIERLRALVSWIEGACVDEASVGEIRGAIERFREDEEYPW